jgi:hypothetical protein
MQKTLIALGLSAGLLQATPAAFIAHDGSFGAKTLIADTESGMTWLQLSVTKEISTVDLWGQLVPGGTFEGWHIAGTREVDEMFVHGGLFPGSAFSPRPSTPEEDAVTRAFTDAWGSTALTGKIDVYPDPYDVFRAGFSWSPGTTGLFFDDSTGATITSTGTGTWLVRDDLAMPVPEPETYAMLIGGLVLLGVRRIQTRQTP